MCMDAFISQIFESKLKNIISFSLFAFHNNLIYKIINFYFKFQNYHDFQSRTTGSIKQSHQS